MPSRKANFWHTRGIITYQYPVWVQPNAHRDRIVRRIRLGYNQVQSLRKFEFRPVSQISRTPSAQFKVVVCKKSIKMAPLCASYSAHIWRENRRNITLPDLYVSSSTKSEHLQPHRAGMTTMATEQNTSIDSVASAARTGSSCSQWTKTWFKPKRKETSTNRVSRFSGKGFRK